MNGKLYTMARSEPETPREGECVICADAATGNILWKNAWNVFLSDVPKERVAWSCVVESTVVVPTETPSTSLAFTGADSPLQLILAGLVAGVGVLLLLAGRRRRA